ncbi:hypothetical protein Ahy_B06g079868 [Arachis hypogaea]|uniref:CCHC-type domain-containing protein n=1 Tax=Arachis hypogaea TaxID=3818 RepID=A0A444YGD0_ARAHY|nr:hypothetical protein Ahy_B06g079868 [Arachis hypogaea]
MKRIYKKGRCRYCGKAGHTKRNCPKRAADEEVAQLQRLLLQRLPLHNPLLLMVVKVRPTLLSLSHKTKVLPSPVRSPKLPLKRKFAKHHEKTSSGSSNPPVTTSPAATPPGSS